MPVDFEEDADIEDEGMIGKIINDARKKHNDINEKIDKNQAESKDGLEKNQVAIKETQTMIEAIQEELQEKIQEKMDQKIGELNDKVD